MKPTAALMAVVFGSLVCVSQGRAESACYSDPNNLVANCGFETGDFTGWMLSGNDVPSALNNLYGVEGTDPLDGISPNNGSYQVYIADLVSNSTTLSQTLSTQAGDIYTISLYLAQDTPVLGTYSNAFSAWFDGVPLVSLTAVPVEGYTLYSYAGLATTSSTVLSLTAGNDLGEFLLDDVDVSTPEPSAIPVLLGVSMAAWILRRRLAARRVALTG